MTRGEAEDWLPNQAGKPVTLSTVPAFIGERLSADAVRTTSSRVSVRIRVTQITPGIPMLWCVFCSFILT